MSSGLKRVERVEWGRLPKDEFDRIVDVLITTHYKELGFDAEAVDGRGGDGGIEIDVRDRETGKLLHIFQVKYFPEGFPTAHKSRRTQIKRSFKSAEKHEPPDWSLVMPSKGTPSERKFVTGLKSAKIRRTHTVGTVELDQMMAKHPDVNQWAVRSERDEALRLVGREDVLPKSAEQFQQAVQDVLERGNKFSPFWGHRLGAFNGHPVTELYPKREDAAEKEPLSLTINTAFGEAHADLEQQWRETIGYGRNRQVTLPSGVVQSIVKHGPVEWFAGESTPEQVVVVPEGREHESVPADVVLRDADGKEVGRLSGDTADQGAGPLGGVLEIDLVGGLHQAWFSDKPGETGRVEQTFSVAGVSAREVARAVRFTEAIKTATDMTLVIGAVEITVGITGGPVPELPADITEYVEDLAAIERLADVHLPVPKKLPTATDRIWVRVIRMLLEGKRPAAPTRTMEVNWRSAAGEPLGDPFGTGAALYVPADPTQTVYLKVEGRSVPVPAFSMAHPNVVVDSARLEGPVEKLTMRINDGTPFRLFGGDELPEDDHSMYEPPDPWQITGIPEASDVYGGKKKS
ncbi:hypothetical protein DEI97_008485 [Curtobacterium sp. MCLR17_032]|uniref:hypothetical protein n=1 Tax=Curtobacterium sp. MCLR17_032 TaxID=2175650 RepID=UPI0011B578A3|nr:hypothetical protein [Curtobacterium sp. MCLR17_032]WIE63163.1 hypothetical protein DEI97_008485 [Curtobacterium sp. MCLR17_032]